MMLDWHQADTAPKDGAHIMVCSGPYSDGWGFTIRRRRALFTILMMDFISVAASSKTPTMTRRSNLRTGATLAVHREPDFFRRSPARP
jgi:hypothetical protein